MRKLKFKCIVDVSREEAYSYWTQKDKLQAFFSPTVIANLAPFGKFEILFDMDAPDGERGAEGMQYMAYEAPDFVSFTWNNPPKLASIRDHRTMVFIRFMDLKDHQTLVEFEHTGFGYSKEWTESMVYFTRAWKDMVLPRFCYACESKKNAFDGDEGNFKSKILFEVD